MVLMVWKWKRGKKMLVNGQKLPVRQEERVQELWCTWF